MTLAWSSLDALRQFRKKLNGIRTKADFVLHDFGMEFLGYIDTIHKKNEMEYEQNLILGSMTLAWSSLGCIEQIRKTKWNTNKI